MFGKTLVALLLFVTLSSAFVVDFVQDLFSSCSDAKNPINPVQGKTS